MVEFMGTSYLSSSMNGTARWAAPKAISIRVKPSRPATSWMNDRIWAFIQTCWSTEGHDAGRPSAEEALNFIQEELSLL
ncbi:hypothetical protein PAXINDRAFT_172481 [Paxillus involutus ATCC 200175]|uniref:Serine-threonine/tyrosine-protein kinase catalytic domain-containing protein n=1 Tax=Paxillus involutus ATCC 200175 TaxID=664439 RepID=A0A0C9TEQ6_PAXIN|nr:hypothetical protein PAXINDRAFT_172481 [Paxillus involutus ATCC 200175]